MLTIRLCGERVQFLFNPNSDAAAKLLHVSPFMMYGARGTRWNLNGLLMTTFISNNGDVWRWGNKMEPGHTVKSIRQEIRGQIDLNDVDEVRFPVDLNKLIGKMFTFKIEITSDNLTNFDEVYVVTNMTDNDSIINELKEKIKMKITKGTFMNISEVKLLSEALRMMMLIPVVITIK